MATPPPPLTIDPPLLNTANPWATDLADLTRLYNCPHTGAVTTRTSLLTGFGHRPELHQFTFFDAATHDPAVTAASGAQANSASLNTLGYSPLTLGEYLGFIQTIAESRAASVSSTPSTTKPKGFLVSVTGGPDDVAECYTCIAAAQRGLPDPSGVPLAMEVNLSCPNIPNAPPPAYDGKALLSYLTAIQGAVATVCAADGTTIPFGFKTPPYTHAGQFDVLIDALRASATSSSTGVCPISFLTSTNTLGSCLVLTAGESGPTPALPGGGIGGMAGAPLHPIALGNVATLRKRLDAEPAALGHIQIVGAGGVSDAAGFGRMKSVGAYAVGVGTGLGIHGVDVFDKILGRPS
ncbi:dihydroorotate dehydrogenase (fumarate) [Sporothrix schenckii 1099-18]|uniref:Dihydroorotate dehydrogenase (Fumarate) n=1 Tax=Sporothrix schenckii 1099-18 TaxID=1397361 RepID=A0A0F2LV46_SPOSC|nr:dihydroorotate dehydrogenase (fumarate) [Sporothrix schenckii 1099-18]KJR81337.1 dihydroorotate dehydrogenase (fumarate) [Sporothrix schenckii 1099-18]